MLLLVQFQLGMQKQEGQVCVVKIFLTIMLSIGFLHVVMGTDVYATEV